MQLPVDDCQNKRGVSIVIPAYNEEHGLGLLLPQLSEVIAASGLPWEVIVVDDGSTDSTAQVARQFGVTLLRRGNNRGYGAALKTGIRHACYKTIVITDADDTYPSDCIPQLLATFQDGQYDMVVGARTGEQYIANPEVAGPNLLKNGDFKQGLEGWGHHPESQATFEVGMDADGKTPVWHVTYEGGNWGVIAQELDLQPDIFYVYEMTVQSTVPVVALYWQTEIGRSLEQGGTYPDWTQLRYVFLTPHWDGQPYRAFFDPVLMLGPGQVWLKQVRLSQLQIETP